MAENDRQNAISASIEFLSVLKLLSDSDFAGESGKAYKKIAAAVSEYVAENIGKKITLSDIARHIGRSPNHTGKAFKAERGISVTVFINGEKMNRAAMLMLTDSATFDDACRHVGIGDTVYGYRLFKKFIGVTPKEYLTIKKLSKN